MRADEVSSSYLPHGWSYGLGQAVAAGVAVGILAAAAAWYFIPIRSAALVRLRFPSQQWMDRQADSPYQSWLTSRSGQADSVTNEAVLSATFEQPGVLRLPCVAEADDPVAWLRKSIRVGFVREPDILQVVLSGSDQDQVVTLTEAFKKAYLGSFLSRQREKRLLHKKTLEERRLRKRAKLKEQTVPVEEPVDKPETEVGQSPKPPKPPQPRAKTELKLRERVELLHAEVDKLDLEIGHLESQLAKANAAEPGDEKTREQALIERYLEATLAEDRAIARGRSLAIALDAAIYEEQLRAVRADQPSVGRLQDRLRAVRQRTARRREQIRPEVSLKLEKQIARGDIPTAPVSRQSRIKRNRQLKTLLEKELKLATSMLDDRSAEENTSRASEKEQAASRTKTGRPEADTSELDRELAHIDTELAALSQVAAWNEKQTPLFSSNADDRLLHIALAGLAAFLATAVFVLQRARSE